VNVSVYDDAVVPETATFVGGLNSVVVDTEVESTDTAEPLIDRIVIGEYVVKSLSPETVTGLAVAPVSTAAPFAYTV
jgi:hypothetical protein